MARRAGLLVPALFGLAALSFAWAAGAAATPITRSFDFEATDLRSQIFDQGVFPVIDPVTGSVTLTFDPMGPAVVDQAEGILAGSINVPVASPVGFNYDPVADILTLGGLGSGVEGGDIADFRLRIGNASTLLPTFLFLSYNESREFWIAQSGSVTLVAEPGAPGLFGLGAGALLLLGFRERRSAPA